MIWWAWLLVGVGTGLVIAAVLLVVFAWMYAGKMID